MNAKQNLSVLLLFHCLAVFASEPWEDPAVNEINRLPARVLTIPCESEVMAFAIQQMQRPKGDSRWVKSLADEWDFKWKSATSATHRGDPRTAKEAPSRNFSLFTHPLFP